MLRTAYTIIVSKCLRRATHPVIIAFSRSSSYAEKKPIVVKLVESIKKRETGIGLLLQVPLLLFYESAVTLDIHILQYPELIPFIVYDIQNVNRFFVFIYPEIDIKVL